MHDIIPRSTIRLRLSSLHRPALHQLRQGFQVAIDLIELRPNCSIWAVCVVLKCLVKLIINQFFSFHILSPYFTRPCCRSNEFWTTPILSNRESRSDHVGNSSLLCPAWIKAWRQQPSSRLWTTSAVRAWQKHLVPRQDLINQAMSIHRSIHDPSTHSSIHLFSQASIHPWIRHHPASSIKHHRTMMNHGFIHWSLHFSLLQPHDFPVRFGTSIGAKPPSKPSVVSQHHSDGTWHLEPPRQDHPRSREFRVEVEMWELWEHQHRQNCHRSWPFEYNYQSNLKYWPQRSNPGGSSGHQVTTYVHLGTSNVHRGCLTPRALSPTQSNAPVSVSSWIQIWYVRKWSK